MRKIAGSLRMGRNTLRGYLAALVEAGLGDGEVDDLPDFGVLKDAVSARIPDKKAPQHLSSVERYPRSVSQPAL